MSNLKYEKNQHGYKVTFDYNRQLLSLFKDTFKTAKWNPDLKFWQTGPRSGKKLAIFEAETKNLVEAINAHEERDLAENDLVKLRDKAKKEITRLERMKEDYEDDYNRLQIEIKNLKDKNENLKSSIEQLKKQHNLSELKAKQSELQSEFKDNIDKLKSIFDTYINWDSIQASKSLMARNMDAGNRRKKEIFREQAKKIEDEHRKLIEAGYRSEGLTILEDANVNRPDRDHPNFVTDEMIYNIKPFKGSL